MIQGRYAGQLVDELLRLLSDRAGWQTILLRQSTIGLMEELAEAGVHAADGVLSSASFDELNRQTRQQILNDPGLGPIQDRGPLLSQSPHGREEFVPTSYKYKAWTSAIPQLKAAYIRKWRKELQGPGYDDTSGPPFAIDPRESACFLASHLLYLGLSNGYLSRWLSFRVKHDPSPYSVDKIIEQLEILVDSGPGNVQVLVGLAQPPRDEVRSTHGWLNATLARQWLENNSHQGPKTLHGGILYESEQWDLDGTLLNVARAVHRLRQRAILKSGRAPEFYGTAWVAGVKDPRRLPETSQLGRALVPGYELGDPHVEAPASDDRLEVAVELLLAALTESGPSVAGMLWAALEALLAAPGDPERVEVANRAGDIALVALVRSSIQVSLGILFSRCPNEALTQRLRGLEAQDRLIEFEGALRREEYDTLPHRSTRLTLAHTRRLFDVNVLRQQREDLRQTLRGLYRQRNLVLHGGVTDGALLASILRSSIPVAASVVNRYARASHDGTKDPHVFAFEMFVRVEAYLRDPRSIVEFF